MKEKQRLEGWVNVGDFGMDCMIYGSKESAQEAALKNEAEDKIGRIIQVELNQEFEVEV